MLVAGPSDVCHSLAHILKEAKTPILLTNLAIQSNLKGHERLACALALRKQSKTRDLSAAGYVVRYAMLLRLLIRN